MTVIGATNGKSDRKRPERKYYDELEKRLRSGRFGHCTAVDGSVEKDERK